MSRVEKLVLFAKPFKGLFLFPPLYCELLTFLGKIIETETGSAKNICYV